MSEMLTVDDIMALRSVNAPVVHPDGKRAAYTVHANVSPPKSPLIPSTIWEVSLEGGEPRPLTADGMRANKPAWSPDGGSLAFLGNRDEGSLQLHLLDGFGEARQLTTTPAGVRDFAWLGDGSGLLLVVTDPEPEHREMDHHAGRDWIVYEHHNRYNRLWHYDLATAELTQRSKADAQVQEFAASADGATIIALISDEPYNWSWYLSRLARLTADGEFETIHQSKRQYTAPSIANAGDQLAVITSTFSDQGMTGGDVLVLSVDGSNPRRITEGHPRSYLAVEWEVGDQRLFATAIEDGVDCTGWLTLEGEWTALWREEAETHFPTPLLNAGKLPDAFIISRSTNHQPPELFSLATADGEMRKLTNHNAAQPQRDFPAVETLHWQAADGWTIQGLLIRPRNSSGPAPMVTLIHGGPTSLWTYGYPGVRSRGWVHLLVDAGYAVLMPNPRGSMGWGLEYAEGNRHDMGGRDWTDIIAGVDYCIAQGIADPERLGVGGWSYGGYLTAWAVTQTGRFKAAVAGASITNWISFHGVSTIPDFDTAIYQSDPHDWDGHYGQFSPMAHVRNTATPTLFLHGEQDPICPVGQAYEMWRALKELGVPTQLTVYPREGHGIREEPHARDVLERALAWWVKYV